jgi:hypothetical protein
MKILTQKRKEKKFKKSICLWSFLEKYNLFVSMSVCMKIWKKFCWWQMNICNVLEWKYNYSCKKKKNLLYSLSVMTCCWINRNDLYSCTWMIYLCRTELEMNIRIKYLWNWIFRNLNGFIALMAVVAFMAVLKHHYVWVNNNFRGKIN